MRDLLCQSIFVGFGAILCTPFTLQLVNPAQICRTIFQQSCAAEPFIMPIRSHRSLSDEAVNDPTLSVSASQAGYAGYVIIETGSTTIEAEATFGAADICDVVPSPPPLVPITSCSPPRTDSPNVNGIDHLHQPDGGCDPQEQQVDGKE